MILTDEDLVRQEQEKRDHIAAIRRKFKEQHKKILNALKMKNEEEGKKVLNLLNSLYITLYNIHMVNYFHLISWKTIF